MKCSICSKEYPKGPDKKWLVFYTFTMLDGKETENETNVCPKCCKTTNGKNMVGMVRITISQFGQPVGPKGRKRKASK